MTLSNNLKSFITSTTILIGISLLGGIAGFLAGKSFAVTFLFIFVAQFILFTFIGNIIKNINFKQMIEKQLEKLEGLSTILECAYCKKQNLMIFNTNDTERIEFVCEHCKNKNLVNIQFIVSQISEPLEIPKVLGVPSDNAETP
jgi:hypothetical protein